MAFSPVPPARSYSGVGPKQPRKQGGWVTNCCALLTYSRQELLDIWTHNSNSFIADLRLIPEISRTPEAAHSPRLGGSAHRRRRDRKQRRGQSKPPADLQNYASSVSLSCVDDEGETADGWKVMITTDDYSYDCADSLSLHGYGVGYYSFCILDSFFSSDPLYFCENSSGQQSDEVSISISDRSVILEIPALPVRAGSNVTLRCRNHRGSKVEAYFFINGSHVGAEHKSELIITNVQKSDEGVYSCSVGVDEESLKSFLRVREPAVTPSSSLVPFSSSLPPPPHFCLY
uniref:uncharacterized protein LOC112431431 n=1 Tax=Maylandia zebra TaxID=106582 RepID=UPI000D3199FF|nr:uncharacterized protein LOC112431431 [Maylandia zebra]